LKQKSENLNFSCATPSSSKSITAISKQKTNNKLQTYSSNINRTDTCFEEESLTISDTKSIENSLEGNYHQQIDSNYKARISNYSLKRSNSNLNLEETKSSRNTQVLSNKQTDMKNTKVSGGIILHNYTESNIITLFFYIF